MNANSYPTYLLALYCCQFSALSVADPGQYLRFDPFRQPEYARPNPPSVAKNSTQAIIEWNPALKATMVAGVHSLVNVNGSILAIGEQIDGYELIEVRERTAVFKHADRRIKLSMDEEKEID